jgi:predicted transcriptional regulator
MAGSFAEYSPILRQDEARRSALHWLTDKAFNGGLGSLVQYLITEEKLSRKEREELKRLLEEIEEPAHDRDSE